jgi:hypothetical protein
LLGLRAVVVARVARPRRRAPERERLIALGLHVHKWWVATRQGFELAPQKVGVPLGVEALRARQTKAAGRNARMDELRSVIDEAAVALIAVLDAMPQLEEIEPSLEKLREAVPRLRKSLFAVWQHEARLAARLGSDSPTVEAYRRVHHLLGQLHDYYSTWLEDPANEPSIGLLDTTQVADALRATRVLCGNVCANRP